MFYLVSTTKSTLSDTVKGIKQYTYWDSRAILRNIESYTKNGFTTLEYSYTFYFIFPKSTILYFIIFL